MHKLFAAVLALMLVGAVQSAPAQEAVAGKIPAMNKSVINYGIPLKAYSPRGASFATFRNRPGILFYFSPTCGHCRHTFPHIQALQKRYEARGLVFVAIASGAASNEDMAEFTSTFRPTMTLFRDQDKSFTTKYGTGSVPLILLVDRRGSYRYWNGSDDATLRGLDSAVKAAVGR